MHLVEQIGECMDSVEAESRKQPETETLIEVKSQGNRIAAQNYIEINIFYGGRVGDVPSQGDAPEARK